MNDLKVVDNNSSLLREICEPVVTVDDDIRSILDNMTRFCAEKTYPKTLSLAANQVGILKRLIVIFDNNEVLKLANPIITKMSGKQIFAEGCVNVGSKSNFPAGFVERPAYIEVAALNYNNELVSIKANGMLAVMLQHEIDHLDGIIFTDKMIGKLHDFKTPEERTAFRKEHPLKIIEEPIYENSNMNKLIKLR